jgi:hypothetical protein
VPDDDEAAVGESVVTGPNSVGIALSPPDDDAADEETDGDALPPGTVAPPDGIIVALLGLGDGVPSPVIGDNEGSVLLDTFMADGATVEGDTVVELPSVMDDDMLGLLLGAVITASVPF